MYSFTEAVKEKPKYFQQSYKPVHPYKNIELVHGINKDFKGNQNAKRSQAALGCQTVPFQFNNGPETINNKAVLNHSQSSFVITSNKCDKLNVNSECSVNEASITVYRLTVRKLSTQSKLDRPLHFRDREPSRIPVRKVIKIMRKRKLRRKCKMIVKKLIPPSSRLFYLITNYKLWYTDFIQKNFHSFYTPYFRFHVLHKPKCKKYCKDIKSKQYSMSDTKLLKSGDIEMNPGPTRNISPQNNVLLATRLQRYGLRPLDVGGGGDCFFRAVSHQLYGDSKFHLNVRALGVRYLSEHPERFIESNIENSWKGYLTNMSHQGTWCDNLIIQALAEKLSITIIIHITESNPRLQK